MARSEENADRKEFAWLPLRRKNFVCKKCRRRFSRGAPLAGKAGTEPIGRKSDAHMVENPPRFVMEDGAHLPVALEFAKGFLDFEQVFVVALDAGGVGLRGGEIDEEKIPAVAGTPGGDGGGGLPGSAMAMRTSRRSRSRSLRQGPRAMRRRLPSCSIFTGRLEPESSSWLSPRRSLSRAG